jgi:hypothetical protein
MIMSLPRTDGDFSGSFRHALQDDPWENPRCRHNSIDSGLHATLLLGQDGGIRPPLGDGHFDNASHPNCFFPL